MSKEAMKLALWHEAMAREPNRNQAKKEKHEATSKFIREALAKQEHEWAQGECVKCGASIEQEHLKPLTDKQIDTLANAAFENYMRDKNDDFDRAFARAIEAAHGIKE